jgi:hypothetical protein
MYICRYLQLHMNCALSHVCVYICMCMCVYICTMLKIVVSVDDSMYVEDATLWQIVTISKNVYSFRNSVYFEEFMSFVNGKYVEKLSLAFSK